MITKNSKLWLAFLVFGLLLATELSHAAIIPQTGWSLLFVDSEELVGENGAAVNAFDGDVNTLWHTQWLGNDDPPPPHEIQIDLGASYDIDGFRYLPRQSEGTNGTIQGYELYVSVDGMSWGSPVAAGAWANNPSEKEVLFSPVTGQFVRLVALSEVNGRRWTSAVEFNVLGVPSSGNLAPNGVIDSPAGDQAIAIGDTVSFTGTGTDPDDNLPLSYLWDFDGAAASATVEDPGLVQFNAPGTYNVTFAVTDGLGLSDSTPATRRIIVSSAGSSGVIPQTGWSLLFVDSEELVGENGAAVNAFDGDVNTLWHTQWLGNYDPPPPHEIQIDLGASYDIDGFRYLPRQSEGTNGTIQGYELYVSVDGMSWGSPVAAGAWANNPSEKEVLFSPVTGQFVRLVALSEVNGRRWTSAVEFNVLGVPSSGNLAPNGVIDSPAGDQAIAIGDTVSFTGTGTDPDDNLPLSYLWGFDGAAASATVEDPGLVQFNAPGTYNVTFAVTDGLGLSDSTPATRTITVNSGNLAPNGVIDSPVGDQAIAVGDTVSFTGTGTDPDDNLPLSYLWDFDGAAASATVEDPGLVQFNAPGTYNVTFAVTDGLGLSDSTPATRRIIVSSGGSSGVIPQTGWRLLFVDSEELVGENGAAVNAFDGDVNTLWHTQWMGNDDPPHPHEIQIDLGAVYELSGFRYLPRQDGGTNGRINGYQFYVSSDGVNWGNPVASGTLVNDSSEKEVLFSSISGQFVRLVALSEFNGRRFTSMAELNLVGIPFSGNFAPNGVIDTPLDNVTISVGETVNFTSTGSDPDDNLPLSYLWNFDGAAANATVEDPGLVQFDTAGTYALSLTVTDALNKSDLSPAVRVIRVLDGGSTTIPQTDWRLLFVDSEELVGENAAAVNAFDGDANTIWHTQWMGSSDPPPPHEIQIDLGLAYEVDGFMYLPRQDGYPNGKIKDYEFFVSADGVDWGNPVAAGTVVDDGTEKQILFLPKIGQFVRLVALNEVNGNAWTSIAEINLEGRCENPYVRILDPRNNDIQPPPDLTISTSVCLSSVSHSGWGVKFKLDGGNQSGGRELTVFSPPFKATFTSVTQTEHVVEAIIVNDQGVEVPGSSTHDIVNSIGSGDYYVATGDSITVGVGDNEPSDDVSQDGRNVEGGYTSILNDQLTSAKGYPHSVEMEAVSGHKSVDGLARLPSVLAKHPNAQFYLLLFGTNDAGGLFPIPSGLGLRIGAGGYPGSFKDNMQQMIESISHAGKMPFLAKVPFTLNPGQNARIQEYNLVIDELTMENALSANPPDFYSFFEMNQGQFSDNLHPNGLGYQSMSTLWLNALP